MASSPRVRRPRTNRQDPLADAVAAARLLAAAPAAAVGVVAGDRLQILASEGYPCDTMAPGAELPLHSGLPLTEAARRRRVVVVGPAEAPRWVAVPFRLAGADAALLVSLGPDSGPVDVAGLQALARSTGRALRRRPPGAVPPTGPPLVPVPWLDAAVRLLQQHGVGGDVVDLWAAGEEACWLLVGDGCGTGLDAAVAAAVARSAVRAAAELTGAADPAAVLSGADRALPTDRFVTAVLARLEPAAGGLRVHWANAGHPPPLLRAPDRTVRSLTGSGEPAAPLALGLGERPTRQSAAELLLAGGLLVAYTDGLVDRAAGDVSPLLERELAAAPDEPAAVAEHLLAALDRLAGPPRDDAAVVVVQPRPGQSRTSLR